MKKSTLIAALLILAAIAAGIALGSCSPIRQAENIRTVEANNVLESYYETVWNKENNAPGERRQARKEVKEYVKQYNQQEARP